MFNSTHTLVGFALARVGLDRWAPYAVWTAVIASNLPDIDIATEFHNTATYIAYHRGITHTVVGVPLLSLALAGVMHAISGNFWRHLWIALIAMTSHPVLDYLNTYGVHPWLPWNSNWFYGDVLFVIDPLIDAMLLGGILLGGWLKRKQLWAAVGMAVLLAYIGGLFQLRNIAESRLAVFTETVAGVERSAVSPQPLDPFGWTGFVETPEAVTLVQISAFRGVERELARLEKSKTTPEIVAAEATRTGSIFLGFARFPVARLYSGPEGHLVQLIDARFYRAGSNAAFAAEIRLDRSLNVVSEDMGFNVSLK
jgi:inner membrane protein